MPIIFDVIFLIYSLLYFPYLLLTKRWHPDYLQRFGLFSADIKARLHHRGRNIWVHAVSVGEVMMAEGFIRRLREMKPGCVVVLSVTTKTGYELALKRLGENNIVIFSPLDFSCVVKAFTRQIRPTVYIAAETEIWPNLFRRLDRDNVPIAIINGRISDRSIGRYRLIKGVLKGILDHVRVFAMQSGWDAERIKELGANPEKVVITGNIKFDDEPANVGHEELRSTLPVFIAGSTHPGEEEIVLDAFKQLQGWRLLIAPRHVDRTDEVTRIVNAAGFKAIRFSEYKDGAPDAVIVVDTIGHLRNLYSEASLVFVGKSLCIGGGHNIIEPAQFAKPVVVGPMIENFRDIVACFKAEEAIVQAGNADEFKMAIRELAEDKSKREALGLRALAVVERNRGASKRTLELIKQWL